MFSAKIDNGEWIHNIKSLSEISSDLLKFQIYNEDYINSLKNRIKNLEEDNFQDKTIQEALKEKDNAIAAMKNGFYILPEDKEKIDNWKREHERIKHTPDRRSAIGGQYSYSFTPTSIGVFKSCECSSCALAARQDARGIEGEYQKLLRDYDAIFFFGDSEI